MTSIDLDRLPSFGITKLLSNAIRASQERKGSAMSVTGANLQYHISESTLQYDWMGTLDASTPIPTYKQAIFDITLQSETAVVPLSDLCATVYHSNNGVTFEEYTYRRGMQDAFNGTSPELRQMLTIQPGAATTPHQARYRLTLFGKPAGFVAFKLRAVATDSVEILVTRRS